MPQMCSVRGCKSRARKNSGISFHCFPREEKRRKLWLSSMCFRVLKWNGKQRVCSRHFKKEDFVFGGNVAKLNKYAIPNVQTLNNTSFSSSLENIPTTSFCKIENISIVKTETDGANCTSPFQSIINNVLTAPAPPISIKEEVKPSTSELHAREIKWADNVFTAAAPPISIKQEVKPSTSELYAREMKWADNVLTTAVTPISIKQEVKPSTSELHAREMKWADDVTNADIPLEEKHYMLTANIITAPSKEGKTQALGENSCRDVRSCKEPCSNLKTITLLQKKVAYLKQKNKILQQQSIPKCQLCLRKFSANGRIILYYNGRC